MEQADWVITLLKWLAITLYGSAQFIFLFLHVRDAFARPPRIIGISSDDCVIKKNNKGKTKRHITCEPVSIGRYCYLSVMAMVIVVGLSMLVVLVLYFGQWMEQGNG